MNKKLFIQFAKKVLTLAEVTIEDKKYYVEGDIVEGAELLDENGEVIGDGEYVISNGESEMKIVVNEGKVQSVELIETEIKDAEQEDPVEPAEKDEKDLKIEELEGLLKDRDAIIEELNQKIKELEDSKQAPLEDPIRMNKVNVEQKEVKSGALKYFE